ncbi:MAG TPA: LTA synthase family protein [Rubricoccaceae bacterium]|nr:LTA synthase family protein [Rubricoccaceae bacterium]
MSQTKQHQRAHLALQREDATRLALLFIPTALLLCFGRMMEFASVRGPGHLGAALWMDAPVPGALLVCAFVVWLLVRRQAMPYPALMATAAALAVGIGGAVVLRLVLPWWVTGWLDLRAFGFMKSDLLILLGAVGILAVALALVGGNRAGRAAVRVLAHGVAAAIAVVVLADLAVLVGTGARGGYFALRDVLARPVELAPVVLSEVTPARAVLLTLPAIIVLAPLAWTARRRTSARPAVSVRHVLGVCVPLLGVVAAAPVPESDLYPEGAVVRMAAMTWEDLTWEGHGMNGPSLTDNPFDLRDTRLVATDSTRTLNVVVVVLESVRRDAVTPYAPALPTTPFLDSLAHHGLLVEEMYTPVPYTNKALTSIFGGIPPSLDSDIVEALPGGIPSPGLPGLLRAHGYRTAFFTPATLAFERKDQILANLGFEEAYGDGAYETAGFEPKVYFGYEDRVVLDRTLAWVADRKQRGEPFFLGMLTLTAHHPYDVPADAARLGLAPANEDLNAYYDAVRYTDDFLRDLIGGFEAEGLLDETVFVIVGDHGEAFGEHGLTTHGNVIWDEALRIPALIYGPALIPEGKRVGGPHLLTDVMPTVAEVLNMDWEGATPPGLSLLHDAPTERVLVHACKDGRAALALRRGARKYVFEYRRRPTRVFDLEADPGERRDVAAHVPPGEVQSAERELVEWAQAVGQAYRLAREEAGVDGERALPSGLQRDLERRPIATVGQ